MSKIGILAFGSLIEDPGVEIKPCIVRRIPLQTPFPVEFGRYGKTRGGAPTLVPVTSGGAPVAAQVLVLRDDVSETEAINMLWRREARKEKTGKPYPARRTARAVCVKTLPNLKGMKTVLYTDFYAKGKIRTPRPRNLALRAIKSVGAVPPGKDGISYLMKAKAAGIATPFMPEIEKVILKRTGTASLQDALAVLKRKNWPNSRLNRKGAPPCRSPAG